MATKHSSGTSKPREKRVQVTDHADPFEREQEKEESSFLLCQAVQRLTVLFHCLPIASRRNFSPAIASIKRRRWPS